MTPHLRGREALAERALDVARGQQVAVPGEAPTAELVRDLAVEALEAGQKIARIDRGLEVLLELHPDGTLVLSLPGMSTPTQSP